MKRTRNDRRRIVGRVLVLGTALIITLVLGWNLVAVVATGIGHFFDSAGPPTQTHPHVTLRRTYKVRFADTLNGIAAHFGVPVSLLTAANHLTNPNDIREGQTLFVPYAIHRQLTEALVRAEAARQHLDPAFAAGLAWEESGFNENEVSNTGAVGVMQVEPDTGQLVATDTGRSYDLGVETDDISVGVYWLAYLDRYYGGNERSAAAAYYEGQGNLAAHGYLVGTKGYVDNVMALRSHFAKTTQLP